MKPAKRRRGRPQRIGGVIGKVLGEIGLEGAERAFRVAERWEAAVGAEVAQHARPVQMRQGVLEVEVESSVWAQQLQMRRPELLAALERELGEAAPTGLHLRVGYTRRPS